MEKSCMLSEEKDKKSKIKLNDLPKQHNPECITRSNMHG